MVLSQIKKKGRLLVKEKKIVIPKIGMRMIKSSVAVFICFLIHMLRGGEGDPFYSVIATILCMQPQVENSRKVAFNRIFGTLIGAMVGIFVLLIQQNVIPANWILVKYILVSFAIIPTIYITLLFKKPTASYISCVVLMSLTIIHGTDSSPFGFAYNRVVETIIGILVSLAVNVAQLPRRRQKDLLLVTGLDGSLVGEDGKMGGYTHMELNHLIADGAAITIATERTPASLLSVLGDVKLNLPVIAMDGAVIFDTNEKRYLRCEAIPEEYARKIYHLFEKEDKHCFVNIVLEDVLLIFYGNFRNDVEKKLYMDMRRSPYRNYVYGELPEEGEVVYFLFVDTIEEAEKMQKRIKQEPYAQELLFLKDTSETPQGYCHLKIYYKNATKQFMVARLREHLGFTKTVAFGSNKNDIQMLRCADLSIAMKQSIEQAKEVSDYVLKRQDLDTVAKTMRQIYEPVIWSKGLQKPEKKGTLL